MHPPWNEDIWLGLTQERERKTHAWLFTGPEGLGKLDLATDYSRELLGRAPNFDAVSNPDFHVLIPEDQADEEGDLLQQYGRRYTITKKGSKPKSIISVDQVRALIDSLVTYAHGINKVVLISPAHRMNVNAANALLKVLEEPPSDTVFILVSSEPDGLSATIRSRCTNVPFQTPPLETALDWLSERSADGEDQQLALSVAGGAPLLAARMLRSDFLAERSQVIKDIRSISMGKTDVVPIASRWKDLGAGQALGILRNMLVDLVRVSFQPDPPYMFNPDQLDWLQGSAKRLHLKRVFSLADRISVYLKDINAPLDKQLVIEDFLLELDDATRHDGGRRG